MSRPPVSYPISSNNASDIFDGSSGGQRVLEASALPKETLQAPRNVSGQARGPVSTLDSFITRLLVVTKQLLQGLDQWSQGLLSEEDVSDIYVRLGNGFELCVTAFRRAGISTADLDSVPHDLREILERALAEDPSQDALNIYLPDIRAIIFNLLSGLKSKQITYKRNIVDRHNVEDSTPSPPARPPPRHQDALPKPLPESRLSARSGTSDGSLSPASNSSILPSSRQPSSTALAERTQQRLPSSSRPAPPDAFRPTRSKAGIDSTGPGQIVENTLSSAPNDSPPITRHQLVDNPVPSPVLLSATSRPTQHTSSHPSRFSRDSFGNPRPSSRFSAESDISAESSVQHSLGQPSSIKRTSVISSNEAFTNSRSDFGSEAGPPTLPILNLPADTLLENNEVSNGTTLTGPSEVPPATRSSLAVLQRSDALERRASKRFSSYTFNKMLPEPPNNKRVPTGSSPQRPTRRADRAPLMPAVQEDLGSPTASQDNDSNSIDRLFESSVSVSGQSHRLNPFSAVESKFVAGSPANTSIEAADDGILAQKEDLSHLATPRLGNPLGDSTLKSASSLTVFLQLGRQVKKSIIDLPLTMSALRLLFMERFEYDPGLEDFPDVYIRDNKTGVQYELEDMDDLTDGCILTLDIEPLEQVKQHFDVTFASLAQEIKELKSSLTQPKRLSATAPPSLLTVSKSPIQSRQLEKLPERNRSSTGVTLDFNQTGDTLPSAELRAHYDEVQSLRRDLAIMRQLHLDFLSQTKESFATLRAQNLAMRDVVKTKMGGNRALLDNSKAKLEARCQDTIQSVEEISDTIDGAREDALRRGITPSEAKMSKIRADLDTATHLVEVFARDVTLAEPTWRATWLSELQRVTEEQRLLAYQNKLAADLKNDIKDATDMLGNVQSFIEQRQSSVRGGSSKFQPKVTEDGGGGIGTLLLEIRTKEADPNQRLRAIEDQQKARERELASRTDDFQNELSGFVQGKKLRKTGGTEEADRIRQRRQDQTLKRMLTTD